MFLMHVHRFQLANWICVKTRELCFMMEVGQDHSVHCPSCTTGPSMTRVPGKVRQHLTDLRAFIGVQIHGL